jgi:hypothetical protein
MPMILRSRRKAVAMAGAQFFTPQRVRPPRPVRRFTLEQANRTLPLVRRIVSDIVKTHRTAGELRARLEEMSGRKQREAQPRLQAMLDRLQDYIDELYEVGCELKDPQTGLIDFVGRHQGRDVYLCWKLGEQNITHWHELDAGFAGRQPISALKETD